MQQEKIDRLTESIENIKAKKNKILFFVPDSQGVASASIYEIYNHCSILRKNGYNAFIMPEKEEYEIPSFLDEDLKILPHKPLKSKKGSNELYIDEELSVEDFLIIPDFFANIMESTKLLPCCRIVFAQSFDYILNGLIPGITWKDFNIHQVITTNNNIKEFIETYHGKDTYDIKTYTVGIPDYFKINDFKNPQVCFYTRNASDILKFSKAFYLKFPELRWISFEDLRQKTREEFAKTMSESIICLWIDRISSFGTTPIEAMKCNTVPLGLAPDIIPEWMVDNSGVWSREFYKLVELLGTLVKMQITDSLPDEIFIKMKEISDQYNIQDSIKSIEKCYKEFFEKRITDIEKVIEIEKNNK